MPKVGEHELLRPGDGQQDPRRAQGLQGAATDVGLRAGICYKLVVHVDVDGMTAPAVLQAMDKETGEIVYRGQFFVMRQPDVEPIMKDLTPTSTSLKMMTFGASHEGLVIDFTSDGPARVCEFRASSKSDAKVAYRVSLATPSPARPAAFSTSAPPLAVSSMVADDGLRVSEEYGSFHDIVDELVGAGHSELMLPAEYSCSSWVSNHYE